VTHRLLAGLAIFAASLALFAGSPYREHNARVDVAALANTIADEDDHVTAVELAQWIRERKQGLRVVDIRSAAECNGYHLPGEELIPLESLPQTRFAPDDTVVLISDGGAHAAQAWVLVRALGHANVYFLRGGVQEWLGDVMSPTNPSPEVAALSRYFGGAPGMEIPGAAPHEANPMRFRRGGC
jgi:rhodanese-related sulfurtransferase